MAGLKSNNNKALGPFTSVPPLPRLVYYDRGTKYYYPLIKPGSTLTWNGYVYFYNKSVGRYFWHLLIEYKICSTKCKSYCIINY